MHRILLLVFCLLLGGCVSLMDTNSGARVKNGQTDTPNYSLTPDVSDPGNRKVRDVPARKTGTIRAYGLLNSVGGFYGRDGTECMANSMGASWTHTDFGDFGRGGQNIAWFFADIEPATGEIVYARAFLNGGYCTADITGDLRAPQNGSYGKVTKNGWEINLTGAFEMEVRGFEEQADAVLNMRGKGDLLAAVNRQTFPGNYVLSTLFGPEKNPAKAANWKKLKDNGDYGSVTLRILR